eukprot:scpid64060/ scgid5381/ 
MGDDGKLVVGVRNHKTGATHLAFVCADGIQLRAMMHYNHQYRRLMAASSDAFLLLPSGGQIESKDHSKMVTWIGKKYGLKMSTATEGRKLIESKVHVSSAFSEADVTQRRLLLYSFTDACMLWINIWRTFSLSVALVASDCPQLVMARLIGSPITQKESKLC